MRGCGTGGGGVEGGEWMHHFNAAAVGDACTVRSAALASQRIAGGDQHSPIPNIHGPTLAHSQPPSIQAKFITQ